MLKTCDSFFTDRHCHAGHSIRATIIVFIALIFSWGIIISAQNYQNNSTQSEEPKNQATGSFSLPTWNPREDKIAFVYDVDGTQEIYISDTQGKNIVRIDSEKGSVSNGKTGPKVFESEPVWSPDGAKLAFISRDAETGMFDVCVVDKNGKNRDCPTRKIAPDEVYPAGVNNDDKSCKTWKEVYPNTKVRFGKDGDRFASCAGGKETKAKKWSDMHPFWHPNGSTLGYCSYRNGIAQIWLLKINSNQSWMYLYNTGMKDTEVAQHFNKESCFASFSPKKGDKLAVSSDGNLQILDLKSGKMKNLTDPLISGNMVDDSFPVWAPQGDRIAFLGRFEAYSAEIYTISASGKKIRRITDNLHQDFIPRWDPKGKSLVYSGFVSGRPPELFVADPLSPEKVQITDNYLLEINPWFSPSGEEVVYVRRDKGKDNLFIIKTKEIIDKRKNGKPVDEEDYIRLVFPDGFNPPQ